MYLYTFMKLCTIIFPRKFSLCDSVFKLYLYNNGPNDYFAFFLELPSYFTTSFSFYQCQEDGEGH